MKAAELIASLPDAKRTERGWQAKCPAHDDRNPSLSIAEGDQGRILLKCHAGCSPLDICRKLGLQVSDLFPKENMNGDQQIETTYDYKDESGKLLFQTVRYRPKSFRQRQPDPKGGWIMNIDGVRRVPFHLPELIEAVKASRPIYLCEGEKDVLAVEKAGFAATCNPMGAGKWRPIYTPYFKGADVIIIADKDTPGRAHAMAVARALLGTAGTVKIIECPDGGGKTVKDAADLFAAGGQASEIDEISAKTKEFSEITTQPQIHSWDELVEDAAEIMSKELPTVVEIVQGVVGENSKLAIVSGSKSFKTWLTIDMALSIAHGVECLGRKTTRTKVLYVNLELKGITFQRRLQSIVRTKNILVDRGQFSHLPLRGKLAGLKVHEIVSLIIQTARNRGARVVIIDPAFKLNIEGEENSSRDQTVFFNEIDRITTEGQSTVILNDHSGKGNQSEKDPLDVIRGSSAKGGDLDAAMVLRKHEVENCFRVDLVHRELPPEKPFVIGWKHPLMELRSDLEPDAMKRLKGGRSRKHDPLQCLSVIKETKENSGISVSAWAKSAGISRQTLQNYLALMRSKGWISTSGEGNTARQYITTTGKEAVSGWENDR